MRSLAKKYSIPKSTLHDHLHGKSKQVGAGGPTVLPPAVEKEIALACTALAEMGFGLTKDLVGVVIVDYLKSNNIPNPFVNDMPGKDWWQRFMKRWPILSERKPQHLSTKRAQAGNAEILTAWFDQVEDVLRSAGIDPCDPSAATRLWNGDETSFCTSVSATKLLARRGCRSVHEIGGGSGRQYITLHCACSGSGERLPPFIL